MAVRRIRPTRRSPRTGSPVHLVGFVERFAGQGIRSGPSETVDAGRVIATSSTWSTASSCARAGLRGAAPARAPRGLRRAVRPVVARRVGRARGGHRRRGAEAGRRRPLPPDDVEAMRQLLLDLLTDNPELADMDERLVAMIARIVEAYGKYNSSRGPSFSSYQALKAMALDELEGKLLADLLAPYGDEPTPTQEQIAKAIAAQRITQLRKMVDAETKRRTAEQLGRDHVQMYGLPQLSEHVEFLRASREQLAQMRRIVEPLARTLATRLAARRRRSRAVRSICARRCAARCPPAACRSTGADQAAPGAAGAGRALRRVRLGRRVQPFHAAAGTCPARAVLTVRVFAFIDTTDEVTHLFGPDADLAVVDAADAAGGRPRIPVDGHSDYGDAFGAFVRPIRTSCAAHRC